MGVHGTKGPNWLFLSKPEHAYVWALVPLLSIVVFDAQWPLPSAVSFGFVCFGYYWRRMVVDCLSKNDISLEDARDQVWPKAGVKAMTTAFLTLVVVVVGGCTYHLIQEFL